MTLPSTTEDGARRKVLSMEVDGETESEYRIQVNDQVKYVVIQPGVFDFDDILCFPPALLENLPPFPPGDWTLMNVGRNPDGSLSYSTSSEPLKGVTRIWHPEKIDVLDLKETGSFGARVRIVEWEGREVIAKIARFDFEIRLVENETRVYEKLARDGERHPDLPAIGPSFLGHLTEEGRVMGMLLEKLEGQRADVEDLSTCEALVKRVHALGIIHGDVNRHNFVMGEDGKASLIDFENAKDLTESAWKQELESLKDQLSEDTGRGLKSEFCD